MCVCVRFNCADADGNGAATIGLSQLNGANASVAGETLTVAVKWVGPTREVLTQSGGVT